MHSRINPHGEYYTRVDCTHISAYTPEGVLVAHNANNRFMASRLGTVGALRDCLLTLCV